ncbi:MAG: heat-inducible transcriptional repressor HrcA [bacterium]
MELSERKRKILSAVVEEYIASAEPVGSRTVLERAGLSCSSATIRNELAALTTEGYLEQPHTSAGRIPTAKGYRFYVNELMAEKALTAEETRRIDTGLRSPEEREKLLAEAGRLTNELTSYPALTMTAPAAATIRRFDLLHIDQNTFIIVVLLSTNEVRNKLVRLPFSFEERMLIRLAAIFNADFTGITREEITPQRIEAAERGAGDGMGLTSVIAGFAAECLAPASDLRPRVSGGESLLKLPEYQDSDKAHRLMSYLSGEAASQLSQLPAAGDIRVLIGPENVAEELKDSSVVLATYDAGDNTRGIIGVVGPTRMDYSKVAAKLSYIADGLSRLLRGTTPPAGFGKLMIKGDDT